MSYIFNNKIASKFKLRHSLAGNYFVTKTGSFTSNNLADASEVTLERAIYLKALWEKYTSFKIEMIPTA